MENKLKINRIKAVLAEKDISHKELAIRVGVAPNSVTRICNNEFQPTLKVVAGDSSCPGCGYPGIADPHADGSGVGEGGVDEVASAGQLPARL